MSRNIPKSRLWRATFRREGRVMDTVYVHAPNRMFARWNAREAYHELDLLSDECAVVPVSALKGK